MDIFKMANEIANNMSTEDKENMENMDMEKMITHVTKNIFKMMNNNPENQSELIEEPEEPKKVHKTRDICFDLNVDLEEFYTGKTKKINVKRKRIVEVDGKQKVVEEKKKLIIPIHPGMKDEEQIVFKGEADQIPGYEAGDIIITLIENEHPIFQRDSDNLIIIKNINLYEIYEYSFNVTHLDNRVLLINKHSNDALHLNDSIRKISGQGMPLYKNTNQYGDLYIRFNLVIPKTLELSKLKKLKEIFENGSEEIIVTDNRYTLEFVSDDELTDSSLYSSEDEDSTDTDSDTSISVSEDELPLKPLPRRR